MPLPLRLLRAALLAPYGLALVAVGGPALALFLLAETQQGRMAGLAVGAVLAIPLGLILAGARRASPWLRKAWLAPLLLFVAASAAVAVLAEARRLPAGPSGLSFRFLGPAEARPSSIWDLVPEIDQVKLGLSLLPGFDPLLDRRRAGRVLGLVLPIYRGLEQDLAWKAMPSALGLCYEEILGIPDRSGHLYAYIPDRTDQGPMPAIVFLHGALGNFQFYLRVLQGYADRHGCAVVCPSFGLGDWRREGGMEAIERAREFCRTCPGIDPERIYLAGLSNGGLGVTRAAARSPRSWAGLVYISAVFESSRLWAEDFRAGWCGRPVLIVHGQEDERIPVGEAHTAEAIMVGAGVFVRGVYVDGEDHFLLLSRPEAVWDALAEFMGR